MSGLPTFRDFYEGVHGRAPFPWQERLAARVVNDGQWPNLLDLPTGSGKTSAIDVALYALAARPEVFPRRIVLVVDRRVVVDQGAEHARRLRSALVKSNDGPAATIAAALRALFDGDDEEPPFTVAVLRGGMPRDEAWAERPDRPVVALATVDQVGSRLLFRGYGVSDRMAPVHAGLLGNDTLFLLDEVHLSTAFAETLHAIQRRWRGWRDPDSAVAIPDRWGVVRMSATPTGTLPDESVVFSLDDGDRGDERLTRRLHASKQVQLQTVRVSGSERVRRQAFARECAAAALRHLDEGARVIAIVVNRVEGARLALSAVEDRIGDRADHVLLTGRMRPLERAWILGRPDQAGSIAARIRAGRTRTPEDRPLIVVATQSIEAGADFDFDALVTECASLDALRQRFGRVDRMGELASTQSTILVRHDQVGDKAADPVYGSALAATWAWLEERSGETGSVDFGAAAFPRPEGPEAKPLFVEPMHAPILLPAHLDAWASTAPRPEPDPDVAYWLHGPRPGVPDVQVVWRADLTEDQLRRRDDLDGIAAQLEAAPPSSLESITLPIYALRGWLAGKPGTSVADVEGASPDSPDADDNEEVGRARPCVLVRRDQPRIAVPDDIPPGATVVVPSTYGGIRHGNWDPESADFVDDLGDRANLVHRGRVVLRLVPAVLGAVPDDVTVKPGFAPACDVAHARAVPVQPGAEDPDFKAPEAVMGWVNEARLTASRPILEILDEVPTRSARGTRTVPIAGGFYALIGRRRARRRYALHVKDFSVDSLTEDPSVDVLSDDDDSGSFLGAECTLERHQTDVAAWVRGFARRLGLSEDAAGDLAMAASLHDIGKVDPRFQQMLVGGSEVRAAMLSEPLAKSAGDTRDFAARRAARQRAGYPDGYRHELLSLALAEHSPLLGSATDSDLVLHLIASHHGWCRPFAPAVDPGPSVVVEHRIDGQVVSADAMHGLARVDSGVADRFFDLLERYGWWTLAWIEAVFRLADHCASAAEQQMMPTAAGQFSSRSVS